MPPRPACTPFPRQNRDPSVQDPLGIDRGDLAIALRATEHRLSALLEDRSRFGRDLHDCVLQSLYAIGLSFDVTRRRPPQDAHGAHDHIMDQLNQLIHDVRRMIQSLATGTVQQFDLASELSTLIAIYEQAGRLRIELDLQPDAIEILTNEEEQEILNIVREALSNCARHAHATHATVSIRRRRKKVRVSVSDDGTGFVPADLRHRGYGLANMTARARKIGGALRVQSRLGKGTHVIAEFSLDPILAPV